jgi:putative ABC transport system permease protein
MLGFQFTVRQAARAVFSRSNRKVNIATVITLGIGIASVTAIMSVVEPVLVRPLPYPSGNRLVSVRLTPRAHRGQDVYAQVADWELFRAWSTARPPVFDELAGYETVPTTLTGSGNAEAILSVAVSSNVFSLLGSFPALGRVFNQDEDVPGQPPVALLSHQFWLDHFGSDSDVVGRTLTLNGREYDIIGVMPPRFRVPLSIPEGDRATGEVWIPLGAYRDAMHSIVDLPVDVLGRLKPGVTTSAAESQLDRVVRQVESQSVEPVVSQITSLRRVVVGQVRTPVLILLGGAVCVLLVACANTANLQIERTLDRSRVYGIRMALGASPLRLIGQQVTEGVLLAGIAGIIGVLLAAVVLPGLVRVADAQLPSTTHVSLNGTVLCFAAASAILTGILTGLGPALRSRRLAPFEGLRVGTFGTGASKGLRWGNGLATAQVALGVTLLVCAGLVGRSLASLTSSDRGYSVNGVAVAAVSLPRERYRNSTDRLAWARAVLQRAQAIPSVTAATIATGAPVLGGGTSRISTSPGSGGAASATTSMAMWAMTPDFFKVLGVPLLRGQTLSADDQRDAVLVDDAAARNLFPGEDPLGKIITWAGGENRGIVVGVVGNIDEFTIDTRRNSFVRRAMPHVYVPLAADTRPFLRLIVRTTGQPANILHPLQRAVSEPDRQVPVTVLHTLHSLVLDAAQRERLLATLISAFTMLAVLMVTIGIYAIMSYRTKLCTHENGLRMALGATRLSVLALTLRRGLTITATGTVFGLLGALSAGRILRSSLVGISPANPVVLVMAAAFVGMVAMLASYFPARRASLVDPMVALRETP